MTSPKKVLVAIPVLRTIGFGGGLRAGKSRWQRLMVNQYLRDNPTATVIYRCADGYQIVKQPGKCPQFMAGP